MLRRTSLSTLLVNIAIHMTAILLTSRLGDPVGDVVPKSGAFAVGHSVLAVVHVVVRKVGRTRLVLEKARVFHHPVGWVEVADDLEGPLCYGIRFFYLSSADRFCSTVFGARRRGPDKVEGAGREQFVIPV